MKILNSCPLSDGRSIYLTVLFDCLIIIMCIISFALCMRSVITGIQLQLVSKPKWFLLLTPKTGCDCLIPLNSLCTRVQEKPCVYNIFKRVHAHS